MLRAVRCQPLTWLASEREKRAMEEAGTQGEKSTKICLAMTVSKNSVKDLKVKNNKNEIIILLCYILITFCL